jgi:integrase
MRPACFCRDAPEIEFEDESAGVVRFLRPDEATRLLTACRKSRNTALADLVEFAMFTGVRRGEALGLSWDRVDHSIVWTSRSGSFKIFQCSVSG